MKRITAVVIFTIVASIVSSNALAQGYGIQAKVPFDFRVSDKTLPSGTYTITSPANGLVRIQSRDRGGSAVAQTTYNGNESTGGCKLVFRKYGSQYFLKEVLSPARASLNLTIVPTKKEERIRVREAGLKENDQIEIAAK
jgi:hypothetical protein